MFKLPTATFITLSGLVAAGLLLIALTGENVSSSMDVMPIIRIPGIPTAIPTAPAVPTMFAPLISRPTATPTPQATPMPSAVPARPSPPESIPGLVQVTEVPSPTPEPASVPAQDDIIEESVYLPTVSSDPVPVPTDVPAVVERSSPSTWLIVGLIAAVGSIFVVFGVYGVIRRGR